MAKKRSAKPTTVPSPRLVLCVLGEWESFDEVEALVGRAAPSFEFDHAFSRTEPDDRMPEAFDASWDRVSPSNTAADVRAIRRHTSVAYLLSPPMPAPESTVLAGVALALTAVLLRAGGLAAKCESAGIAHGRERWLELSDDFAKADDAFAAGVCLYETWVRRPLVDDRVHHSCGMHLLGLPEVETDADLEEEEALAWLDGLGLYLAADRPTRPIMDGEGFRLSDEGSRRLLRRVPCRRYAPDDFMFNPYGGLRLAPARA